MGGRADLEGMERTSSTLPAAPRATASLTLKLRSVGNPDYGQRGAQSPPKTLTVASVEEAAQAARAYIEDWNLGSGNVPPLYVMRGKVKVARIFYNGSVAMPGERWF